MATFCRLPSESFLGATDLPEPSLVCYVSGYGLKFLTIEIIEIAIDKNSGQIRYFSENGLLADCPVARALAEAPDMTFANETIPAFIPYGQKMQYRCKDQSVVGTLSLVLQ